MIIRSFLLLSALCASASIQAESDSARRARVFATLPDWTGIWQAAFWVEKGDDVSGRFPGGVDALRKELQLTAHPPLNAVWEAKYQAGLKGSATNEASTSEAKTCQFSFPDVMDFPLTFQMVVTPEETVMLVETGQARHIYTDGRRHPDPDDLWPTLLGDSIGHWEADTLVIDTIARKAGMVTLFSPAELSEQAHFTERLRRVDESTLKNEMTIEDPERLRAPWKVTIEYRRLGVNRLIPWDCFENDRNQVIDGKLTISPAH